jgi:hypothetical protein
MFVYIHLQHTSKDTIRSESGTHFMGLAWNPHEPLRTLSNTRQEISACRGQNSKAHKIPRIAGAKTHPHTCIYIYIIYIYIRHKIIALFIS